VDGQQSASTTRQNTTAICCVQVVLPLLIKYNFAFKKLVLAGLTERALARRHTPHTTRSPDTVIPGTCGGGG